MKKYFFSQEDERLKRKTETEAFKHFEEILDLIYKLDLSFEEASELLKITPEEYIDYLYGEENISKEEYQEAMKELKAYKGKKDAKIGIG